jgi:DNA-binding transcriptional MocR family regulator
VVDEALVELSLEGQSNQLPLGSVLPDAISIGSASKAFWGGLRIGWIRAPYDLVAALTETRLTGDLGSSAYEQLVVAELLADPEQVLAANRERLRTQRDHLAEALSRALPEWQFWVPDGGLSLWVQLPGEQSTRMAAASDQHGLILTPGPRFFVNGGGERHLRVPFSSDPQTLSAAVTRLAATWRSVQSGRAADRPSFARGLTA